MTKTKTRDKLEGLPAPLALTPDQVKEVAAITAGGVGSLALSQWIIAGGRPANPVSLPSLGQPSFNQQAAQLNAPSTG